MKIRKSDERIDENELNMGEIFALSNLLKTASEDRVKYLISLFNNDVKTIENFEKCFLINYVAKGRLRDLLNEEYALYVNDSGKKMILSSEEVKTGNYTIEDTPQVDIHRGASRNSATTIQDLEKIGFKFLETEEHLLAFCSERNIVLWAPSIEKFNRAFQTRNNYFQQPRVTFDGDKVVSMYSSVDNCEKEKTDFPLFKDGGSYLWLYDKEEDKGSDSVFNCSMKRIAQYPELYHAVGSENQAIIDEIILNELYSKLDEIYYNSDASLNSKKLYMIQIVKEQYGVDSKKAAELLSTKYDFQIRNVDVREGKSK